MIPWTLGAVCRITEGCLGHLLHRRRMAEMEQRQKHRDREAINTQCFSDEACHWIDGIRSKFGGLDSTFRVLLMSVFKTTMLRVGRSLAVPCVRLHMEEVSIQWNPIPLCQPQFSFSVLNFLFLSLAASPTETVVYLRGTRLRRR